MKDTPGQGGQNSDLARSLKAEEALFRDLERAAKPLGDLLKRGAERVGRLEQVQPHYALAKPDPTATPDFPTYLQSLAVRTGALGSMAFELESAVGPAAEPPPRSSQPADEITASHARARQAASAAGETSRPNMRGRPGRRGGDAELPRYLDDLRARLHALGFAGLSIRDFLLARAAQASSDQEAVNDVSPELRSLMVFGGPEDIRAYLEALTARVASFRHAAMRLEQAFKDGADLLRRLEPPAASPPPPPPPTVVAVPLPPPPRPVAVAAAPEPSAILLPRPRIIDVSGQPRRGGLIGLNESFWSHRRLRWLILLIALMALLIAFSTAWFWNRGYAQQRFARATVARMHNATSYRAVGIDIVRDSQAIAEIRESFDWVAPDSVSTRYLTTMRQADSGGELRPPCTDKDIVVLGSTRYQNCKDNDASVKGWVIDGFDPKVFATSLFEPWQRFAWCTNIKEEDEEVLVNGVPTRQFSCSVPAIQEARIIFEQKGTGTLADQNMTPQESREKQQKYIQEAKIDVTVWVRQTDGFIGRFAITKTAPGDSGPVTETADIRYSDFNLVPAIPPPDTTTPMEKPAQPSDNPNFRPSMAIIGSQTFFLEVAADDFTRQSGLSNRAPASFPTDRGMLFMFPKEDIHRFWMKDTQIPLDAVFLDNTKRIVDMITMEPQPGAKDADLVVYAPRQRALWVLEINAGLAKKYGFQIGRVVEFQ